MGDDIVMIVADDLFNVNRFRNAFGIEIQTPNMDVLAAMGVTFNNAYAATALCNPSRTAIMTGQSPFTTGVHHNNQPWADHVNPADTLIGTLRASGYETAGFGKILHRLTDGVASLLFKTFSKGAPTDESSRDLITAQQAAEFLSTYSGPDPLLLVAGLHDPHAPFTSPQEFLDLYPLDLIEVPAWTGDQPPAFVQAFLGIVAGTPPADLAETVQGYLANISEMDARLGEMLDAIEASGRNPTIVFHSDHGLSTGDHDYLGKFSLWEAAANAPLIIAQPGGPSGVVSDEIISFLDIAPTILQLAGVAIPATMQGQSLLPFLGGSGAYSAGPVMTSMSGSVSIRDGEWRITRYEDGSIELFNVADDPACAHNLHGTSENAAIESSLLDTLDGMLAGVGVTYSPGLTVHQADNGDTDYFVIDADALAAVVDTGGDDTVLSFDNQTRLPDWAEDLVSLNSGARTYGNKGANFILMDVARGFTSADNNVIRGLAGNDTMEGGDARGRYYGGDGNDRIEGGRRGDFLNGEAGQDRLAGGGGNDRLRGATGKDILVGNSGNDRLEGGNGSDVLSGSSGRDKFVFTAGIAGIDTISDYVAGKDKILLFGVAAEDVTIADHDADAWISYGAQTIKVIGAAGLTVADLQFG